jgi:hypothetical protein
MIVAKHVMVQPKKIASPVEMRNIISLIVKDIVLIVTLFNPDS